LRVALPLDPVEQFRERLAHEVTTFDRRDSAALRADPGPEASAFQRLSENPVITTMFVASPPWNDLRLRQAIAAALDPRELIVRLAGGNGQTSWPVLTVPEPAYALSEAQLTARLGTVDEARTRAAGLWDAAAGASLGTVTIDIPNVFDPRFSASSVVVDLLSAALGTQFRAAVLPYTEISATAAAQGYGNGQAALWFGWSPPIVDPDPARNLFETYSSRGPNFATTGFASAEVDAALDRLLAEDDADARLALLPAAHEAIAAEAGGGVISWFNQVLHVFRWPFLERAAPSAWFDQYLDAETSLDTADPRYQ
jgi:ABC-type transport system substrate-binding protein